MKQGWDTKWIVLEDMKLSIYDSEDTGKRLIRDGYVASYYTN